MLSNTDLYCIFLTSRAMSLFHTAVLHNHFFPGNWNYKFESKSWFDSVPKCKKKKRRSWVPTTSNNQNLSWNHIFQMTFFRNAVTNIFHSMNKQKERFCSDVEVLNNEFSIMQHFSDNQSKEIHRLIEKWIWIVSSLNAKPHWGRML